MKFSLVLAVLCVVCGAAYGNRLSWQVVNRGNGTAPKPRRDAGIAYDPNQKILVLFGGRAGSEIYGDTWVYETLTSMYSPPGFKIILTLMLLVANLANTK